ncbi:MAG TPA: DUF5677 domain-containing protein [Thermoanaerobaculia bacterium]|nr:DUF5677 domain-containing protein [Thermoanaerobaculia bacterium]
MSRAAKALWYRLVRTLGAAPSPPTVLKHRLTESIRFRQRQDAFIASFGSLRALVDLAFDRQPSSEAAGLMVFGLGRRIASDFDDIVLLSTESRPESALALIRGMFERLITARYLHHHPDEAMSFANYDIIQRRKLGRRIKDVLGLPEGYEEKLQQLEEEAKTIEHEYLVTDCKACNTMRLNHTWNKLDVVAMASHTEKQIEQLKTVAEQKEAARTRDRLRKLTVFGYFDPMGHTHASLKSISARFVHAGKTLTVTEPSHESVDHTVWLAHLLLLESLLIQDARFHLPRFEELFSVAMQDFKEAWVQELSNTSPSASA